MGKQRVVETTEAPAYVAVTGLNYGCTDDDPHGTRIEAGEIVPAEVVAASPWLIEQGIVKEAVSE